MKFKDQAYEKDPTLNFLSSKGMEQGSLWKIERKHCE